VAFSRFLFDAQLEVPSIVSRWLLAEVAGAPHVFDDAGGILLPTLGSPTLGIASMARGDGNTCAQGGYSSQLDGFSASVAAFDVVSGVSVEGITALDPHAVTFHLFTAPGQAQLDIAGAQISFSVWTTGQSTLTTTTSPLFGPPQLVQGVFDPGAQKQLIYVDGVLVASKTLSGSVATSTTGNTEVLVAGSASACVARGQDVAVYSAPLSANRVLEHYQAFAQQWLDPEHTRVYPYIGITQ